MSALHTAHLSKYAMQADISSKEITLLKRRRKDKSILSSRFCSQSTQGYLFQLSALGTEMNSHCTFSAESENMKGFNAYLW